MVAEAITPRYVSLDALIDELFGDEAAEDSAPTDKVQSLPVDNRTDKPYSPGSIRPLPPLVSSPLSSSAEGGQEGLSEETLEDAADLARALLHAAQTATSSRHALDFPTWARQAGSQRTRPRPGLWADRQRRASSGEVLNPATRIGGTVDWFEDAEGRRRPVYKAPGVAYWTDWHTWLTVASFRWLNSAFRAGEFSADADGGIGADGPTHEELQAAFALIMQRHGERVSWYEVGMGNTSPRGFREPEEVERLAASAARYVAETWDADYIQQRVEWGRTGGKASKRRPVAYEAFLTLPRGLSQREQAERLHVSVKTIARYEERQRAERA